MTDRLSALLESVRTEVRRRPETDRIVSPAWLLVPILWVVLSVVLVLFVFASFVAFTPGFTSGQPLGPGGLAALLGSLIALTVVVLVAFVIFIYLLYVLIRRRNKHFARHARLLEATVDCLKEAAQAKGADVGTRLVSLEHSLRELRDEEGEKGAVLWVVLVLLTGFALYYVYYFLMRDFHRHERKEDGLLEDVNYVLAALDQPEIPRRTEPIPKRSFVVYLILTIVTGIFGIYWIYTLIKDPNTHFREQSRIETELLSRLEALV